MPFFCAALSRYCTSPAPPPETSIGMLAEILALAVDDARLPAVVQDEARALRAQPRHGVETLRDENFREIGIGAKTREAEEHVEEFVRGIGAEVAVGGFFVGDIGDAPQIVDGRVGEAHDAAGEAAVAAVFVFACRFQHQNLGAAFLRRERGAQRGVAFAYHDHVVLLCSHCFLRRGNN